MLVYWAFLSFSTTFLTGTLQIFLLCLGLVWVVSRRTQTVQNTYHVAHTTFSMPIITNGSIDNPQIVHTYLKLESISLTAKLLQFRIGMFHKKISLLYHVCTKVSVLYTPVSDNVTNTSVFNLRYKRCISCQNIYTWKCRADENFDETRCYWRQVILIHVSSDNVENLLVVNIDGARLDQRHLPIQQMMIHWS